MIIEALYRHEEPGRVSCQKRRQAESDTLFARFIPEHGERIPFEDTMIPIEQFSEWFAEIDSLYETLAQVAQDEYNELMSTI